MKLSRLQASMQLTKLEMSPLTTSSLLPVPMPSTKISISSLLGSPRDAMKLSQYVFGSIEVRHRLSVFDRVALPDQHLVIQCLLRSVILNNLHSANQGVTGIQIMQINVYIGLALTPSIQNHRATCHDCIRNAPS